jgi:cysteine desulfurase/selenocysteine lyase
VVNPSADDATRQDHDMTTPDNGLDVAALRADTPGCASVVHLNNAGAALMPTPVIDAVIDHVRLEAQIGGYEAAASARDAMDHTYDAVAELIGAQRDEIALVENATRAWDMAFYSLPFEPGDRIITSTAEYASNAIALLQVARRTGAVVDVVPDDETGQLSLESLEALIQDRTRLIAITHVPTQGGLVNPAAEVGALARAAGIPYLLDACQSVGQLAIDVEAIGCDFLSATGRKYLRGPRGVGFLYVRGEMIGQLEPPFLDLHAATWVSADRYEVQPGAQRFETWESSAALRLGLAAAVDYLLALGIEAVEARITLLAERLRGLLAELPHIDLHDKGARRCGLVSFTDRNRPAEEVAADLRAQAINVSVSGPESARYDFDQRRLGTIVRASVHCYNTDDELDRLVGALRQGL